MYSNLLDRFIRYAKKDTRSDETSETVPTTQSQKDFAYDLMKELEEMGLDEVEYNGDNGYVTATLPANIEEEVPTIGFIAHMDTADFNSENIRPQIHEDYDGGTIVLNKEQDIKLSPDEFPNLKNYVGETLITTDGTTLLGADDKAGIAEIMTAAEYLIDHPEIKHGKVRLGFGPDEEIGRGAQRFDVEHFDADFAYTVDGGPVGELEYESFNAASADLHIEGKNIHPGTAKNKMVNALNLAHQFHAELPQDERPEHTEGREGFYHLLNVEGNEEEAKMSYIIRDHDRDKFEKRKEKMQDIAAKINRDYDKERITVDLKDQYYNMAEVIEKDMTSVELAKEAMEELDIEPDITPIRGGTDGSIISFMGLPTPNLFAGGENFHGRYEFVSLQSMAKATDVIIEIIKSNAK